MLAQRWQKPKSLDDQACQNTATSFYYFLLLLDGNHLADLKLVSAAGHCSRRIKYLAAIQVK